MVEVASHDGNSERKRRWTFADCQFDESNWALTVGGHRVSAEIKPLELLRELLGQNGHLITKEDLLRTIWPDVIVVESSLATAVRKLRRALRDDERGTPIIETVSRIGYRLAVPVTLEEVREDGVGPSIGAMVSTIPTEPPDATTNAKSTSSGRLNLLVISGITVLAMGGTTLMLSSSRQVSATNMIRQISPQDAKNAMRSLDVAAVQQMLAAGWNPNAPVDSVGSAALHYVAEICEWNPTADRGRMVLLARTIYEGGGRLDQRNVYGDTPYSIAKAPRYCGPSHPVTAMMRATCNLHGEVMEGCEAAYEVARRGRR